jgi:DNA-directed RNA polymerase specialized sigma24 family protein
MVLLVHRDQAIAELPTSYQRVLRWLDEGCSDDDIAARLAIDPHAVTSLIDVAKGKLDRLMREGYA